MPEKRCLLIVDIQNDFCPGGALPVPGGDGIVPVINCIITLFDLVIASRDMHPPESRHFQTWPVHCVKGTFGADFHPLLRTEKVTCFIEKGTSPDDDGYSDFASAGLDLASYLRDHGVEEIYVCGLATEYCVKETVLDALRHGFTTFVLEDCVRAVDLRPHDGRKALREMRERGAVLVSSADLRGCAAAAPER